MNRYNLALLLLALVAIPLFTVSIWLGVLALVAIYALLASLANASLDHQRRMLRAPGPLKRAADRREALPERSFRGARSLGPPC